MMLRLLAVVAVVCGMARAQQPIGTVGVQDATIAGALVVTNGRAVLVGSTSVTAKDHTAEVSLSRGGSVRVCATSGLHVTSGKSATGSAPVPLMLALDRGAVEVQMTATTSDVVMTPDLRFTMASEGPLDMRLRVTSNGDTCVENRGAGAPILRVADPFGGATYELRAGQHVLFEHGSLKEVVDNESSPCGCPPMPVVSVADAGTSSSAPAAVGSAVAAKSVEEQHPFPAAVSAGLAPMAAVPQAPPGVIHTQVATSLHYDAGAAAGAPGSTATATATAGGEPDGSRANTSTPPAAETEKATAPAASAAAPAPAAGIAAPPPPPTALPANDLAHSIGRFFKRLFGRH